MGPVLRLVYKGVINDFKGIHVLGPLAWALTQEFPNIRAA